MTQAAMAVLHRPVDPRELAREAQALADRGLTARDVAAALGLSPPAAQALLNLSATAGAPSTPKEIV